MFFVDFLACCETLLLCRVMAFKTPLSEYELLRERNIKERESLWQDLVQEKAEVSEAIQPKQRKSSKKSKSYVENSAPVRRSDRLKGKNLPKRHIEPSKCNLYLRLINHLPTSQSNNS